jgi:hypothetical protein
MSFRRKLLIFILVAAAFLAGYLASIMVPRASSQRAIETRLAFSPGKKAPAGPEEAAVPSGPQEPVPAAGKKTDRPAFPRSRKG